MSQLYQIIKKNQPIQIQISHFFYQSIIMLSIQKLENFRQRSISPKFRFTHQSAMSTQQLNKKQRQLSSVHIYKTKHVYHQSELSSVKFKYLHKFDWQKVEKKFDIIQRLQRNTRKSDNPFAVNHHFTNRLRINSMDLNFEFLSPWETKNKNHSVASSPKSTFSSCGSEAHIKRKLEYRLKQHQRYIAEFGVNQNKQQRLYKMKKNRDGLCKKPMKRVIIFHRPDGFLQ